MRRFFIYRNEFCKNDARGAISPRRTTGETGQGADDGTEQKGWQQEQRRRRQQPRWLEPARQQQRKRQQPQWLELRFARRFQPRRVQEEVASFPISELLSDSEICSSFRPAIDRHYPIEEV